MGLGKGIDDGEMEGTGKKGWSEKGNIKIM
jgi:hypothetical protein